ncbi:hypothetical protein OTK49_02695 [Vibrio coralliirubri]|uniref:hypothetical protein n=1 Tax=Vibrio coralliirubri TaxID=1516159 RepID=UPI002284963B|nr:hypothetical protein [Vibrio coralliirubri]MCY9861426.1 hypothetical protein [Vibrio coralliirubri]
MKTKLKITAGVIAFILCFYGLYQAKRKFNYEVGYSSMVTKDVKSQMCSLIKPEKHEEIFVFPTMCK